MSTKYMTINNEVFPYENAKYGDTDTRITGRHLMHCFTQDIPTSRVERLKSLGVIDIRDMAEDKVLAMNPEYQELTSYGTRRKGYYKLLNEQIRKTMFWAINKQPASFTMIVNSITGMSRKADEATNPDSIYGKIQLCMQLGITTQIVIPETGYSCMIQPVCNKKQMDLFTKDFICDKTIRLYEAGELMDTELIANIDKVYEKAERLQDYRQSVQNEIWNRINYALKDNGYIQEFKMQNIYTMHTRVAFAVNTQTEAILHKYAEDFKIPSASALTLKDLQDPKVYNEMIRIVSNYASAFGIRVKTTEQSSEVTSYLPHKWFRDDNNTMTEAVMLKRAYMEQQSRKPDSLNDILNAYIQIDWYMSQPDMVNFLVDGYTLCIECAHILSKHDEFCPVCGRPNPDYEPDELSYEIMEYKLSQDNE